MRRWICTLAAMLALPAFAAQQVVITTPTADRADVAFTKLNANDAELYALEALKAPLASPALTGTPTAPTPSANDNSTKLATTAYADRVGTSAGTIFGTFFNARLYGSCTWDASHDVGACINSAIAAAASTGGGTVILPCGTYGLSTQVLNQTSGVKLLGCGTGFPKTTGFLPITKLLWIGGATANPAVLIQTASGGGPVVKSADVWGMTVDCASLCGIAVKINGVAYSFFNFGGAEATSANIVFSTPADLASIGNQHDDMWLYSVSTSASNSPTGILLDKGSGSSFNTSYNTIHELFAVYNKGDGIVFGASDNNMVELISGFATSLGTSTGSFAVCANDNYTPPSGVKVNGYCREMRILHMGGNALNVKGYQTGSTFSATGGNGGSAALNPLTIPTNATSATATSVLNFASTTGASASESVSCGGPQNGVFNGTPIAQVLSTTVTILGQFPTTVPSSTNCTFTYGFNQSAVAGTYTLTATSSTQYTLTAPAGGHTQSGITASGGFLTFTDIVIPWTGTPNTGDSWTITVPTPPTKVGVEFVDRDNNLPNPTFEVGSTGYYQDSAKLYAVGWNLQCILNGQASSSGIANTATGASSCAVGGAGNNVTGQNAVAIAGTGNTPSGFDAVTIGANNSASGTAGLVAGTNASDRGRLAAFCFSSGNISVTGDAQTCVETLSGTGSSTSAIRLTANGNSAASTNCINIPNNTAYGLSISVNAFDHTSVTKSASWTNISALLTRGATAASTALNIANANPVQTFSNGTITGSSLSISADTTNGCLNVSWTPPSGNTDTWNVAARVVSTEAQ